MLKPNDRNLLVHSLNPPIGYGFDTGAITTFSLQPEALLSAPLHLSWLAHGGDSGLPDDPIRLLEGLKRVAARLTIFSDSGRMLQPFRSIPLAGLMEDMIHEVRAPRKGAFHPKVWLLRFLPQEGPGPAILRLLILSRNLTFDSSWDLCLELEGSPGKRGVAANAPLLELFNGALNLKAPGGRPVSSQRVQLLQSLLADARTVDWSIPEGFDEWKFHALGLGSRAREWMPDDSDDLLVVSPFVTADALERLAQTSRVKPLLVSRPEELDTIPESTLSKFRDIRVLEERCDQLTEEDSSGSPQLHGLHAKAFITKAGWDATFVVGSANASSAALLASSNVEFLCSLKGRHSKTAKPEDLLSEDRMGPILVPYQRSVSEPSEGKDEREILLEKARALIADAPLHGVCLKKGGLEWDLSIQCVPRLLDLEDVEVRIWPLTMDSSRGQEPTAEGMVQFGPLDASELTSLFGFSLQAGPERLDFARAIELVGVPAERESRILLRVLNNPNGFLRYLRLLLEELQGGGGGEDGLPPWLAQGREGHGGPEDTPFFEMMAKAYSRHPASLQAIDVVVRRLEESPEHSQVIPQDFLDLWQVFRQVVPAEIQG